MKVNECALRNEIATRAAWYFARTGWHSAAAAMQSYSFNWSLLLTEYPRLAEKHQTAELLRVLNALSGAGDV